VRLSPKSVFLGVVALGLPFSVTVGWQLGHPDATPSPVSGPAGGGILGSAPARATTPEPVTVVDWSSPAPRTRTSAQRTTPPASSSPSPVQPSPGAASAGPLPTLTVPPVPTPTDVTNPPSSPSATPSASATPKPSGLNAARLVRRS
jgi:hypothetical protein